MSFNNLSKLKIGGKMAYKQCSRCNIITDENESKCPSCANNHLDNKIITTKELASRIEKREISLSKIWTKYPGKIYQILKSLP